MNSMTGFTLIALLTMSPLAQSQDATQELTKLENAWATAVVKRDEAFLKQLYADEYMYTDSEGHIFDEKGDITEIVSGKSKIDSYKLSDMKVHLYGDTAVVTGLNTLKGSYEGKDMSGGYRFTDVFVKRDGRWQVVATQSSKVASGSKQ